MSLSYPIYDTLTHQYFYYKWPSVKQSGMATHFSTDEKILESNDHITGHYTKYDI